MQLLTEIWRNKWARLLILIFVALEIYTAAILPAIRGTADTVKANTESRAATRTPDF